MIFLKKIIYGALLFFSFLSCTVNNPEPIQDLEKEIVGHWTSTDKSIHFTESGTFQDSTFRTKEQLFNNHTCEVNENKAKVLTSVVSGNYTVADTLVEFSSINASNCNPEPVELQMRPYFDKIVSISNDSLTLTSTRVYVRESISDTTLFGRWKTINYGSIYNYELPNGWIAAEITEELLITNSAYSSIIYSNVFPNDSLTYESNYFFDPPEFINGCCAVPFSYLVDLNDNKMRWTGPDIGGRYRYVKTNY